MKGEATRSKWIDGDRNNRCSVKSLVTDGCQFHGQSEAVGLFMAPRFRIFGACEGAGTFPYVWHLGMRLSLMFGAIEY